MPVRPCFLVVDHEFAGSISSRKLVLETAKFNVITAYSYGEALATLERFPNVHACVVNASGDGKAEQFLMEVRSTYPKVKLVMTGWQANADTVVDLHVETYSPERLLTGLRGLFPAEAAAVDRHEKELEAGTAPQE